MAKKKIGNLSAVLDEEYLGAKQLLKPTSETTVDDKPEKIEEKVVTYNLKIPKRIHMSVKLLAVNTGTNMNQLIIDAVSRQYDIEKMVS